MNDLLKCGYKRNSFDRYCDDINEEILQYLKLIDKVRLECISKQWKRVIYARQNDLDIDDVGFYGITFANNNCKVFAKKLMEFYDSSYAPELYGVTVLQRLLEKCNRVTHIKIGFLGLVFLNWNTNTYNQLIRIIADNCHSLQTLNYSFGSYNMLNFTSKDWKYFCEKQAKTLKKIKYSGFSKNNKLINIPLLKCCENCMSVKNISLKQLVGNEFKMVPKLEEFKGGDFERPDLVECFVERYKNTLKVLNIHFNAYIGSIIKLLQQVSLLSNLSRLKLDMSGVNYRIFYENKFILANNWNHLTQLKLYISFCSESIDFSFHNSKIMNLFNNCLRLTYLSLKIHFFTENIIAKNEIKFSLDIVLKNFTNLTSLHIDLYTNEEYIFTDIELYLPKLKCIIITAYNKNVTDLTLNCLEKLQQLSRFKVYGNSKITDLGVCGLIEHCSQLISFVLVESCYITNKTTKKLIEIARNRPKIKMHYVFIRSKRAIIMENFVSKNIPTNLEIETENGLNIN